MFKYYSEGNRICLEFLFLKIKISKKGSIHSLLLDMVYKIFLPFLSQIFIYKNKKYNNRPNKTVKKRLFITTGNLNLVNNLVIIKQFPEENVEDSLFVWSRLVNDEFIDITNKIASVNKFKNFYTLYDKTISKVGTFFVKNNLYNFDEVYISNQVSFIELFKLYQHSTINITDEAVYGAVAKNRIDYNNVNKIYTNKYIDKIDYLGYGSEILNKISYLDTKIFKEVTSQLPAIGSTNLGLEEKSVIFCGTYWDAFKLTKEQFQKLQNAILQVFINRGYNVYFKPHPRDKYYYEIPEGVKIFDSRYPLECINLEKVLAIVSFCSSASLQISHFQNVPGFIVATGLFKDKFISSFWQEYAPSLSELLKIDATQYSHTELKMMIDNIYNSYIGQKPLLSENKKLQDLYIKYKKEKN